MERTLAEKLLTEAAGHSVGAGETVVARVDRALLQDGTAPRALERLRALGRPDLALADRTTLFIDHGAPPPTPEIARQQQQLVEDCRSRGFDVSGPGEGISHQVMVENLVSPGEVLVGADSHTCMAGALCALALGMGSTDVACAIALAETWLVVPESLKVELRGVLATGVSVKDAMLSLIGLLGAQGASNLCMEFAGEGLAGLDMASRFVLANLSAEVGAKTALLPTDGVVREFLTSRGRGNRFVEWLPDAGARYSRHLKWDLSGQEPMVARPGRHEDVVPVAEVAGEPVQQVVVGSCTNGRVQDFEAAARVLKGHRIHAGVRLVLAPASRTVLESSFESGAMQRLLEAGGTLVTPGCGPCIGIHQGVLGDEQTCVATQSRNWPGRMGSHRARIYLASPYTAAASALRGALTDPREVLDGA